MFKITCYLYHTFRFPIFSVRVHRSWSKWSRNKPSVERSCNSDDLEKNEKIPGKVASPGDSSRELFGDGENVTFWKG